MAPGAAIPLALVQAAGSIAASRSEGRLSDMDEYIRSNVPFYLLIVSYGCYEVSETLEVDDSGRPYVRIASDEIGGVDMYYAVFDLQNGPEPYRLAPGEFGTLQAASGSPGLYSAGQTAQPTRHGFTRC